MSVSWGQCYDFGNVFAEKIDQIFEVCTLLHICVHFHSKYSYLCRKNAPKIGHRKIAIFCWKSVKIVITTVTPESLWRVSTQAHRPSLEVDLFSGRWLKVSSAAVQNSGGISARIGAREAVVVDARPFHRALEFWRTLWRRKTWRRK
jgi:hypothetical protein